MNKLVESLFYIPKQDFFSLINCNQIDFYHQTTLTDGLNCLNKPEIVWYENFLLTNCIIPLIKNHYHEKTISNWPYINEKHSLVNFQINSVPLNPDKLLWLKAGFAVPIMELAWIEPNLVQQFNKKQTKIIINCNSQGNVSIGEISELNIIKSQSIKRTRIHGSNRIPVLQDANLRLSKIITI